MFLEIARMLVSHASHGLHPFSITASPALRVVMLLESGHIETSNHWQSRPFYVGPVWVLPPTLPQGRTCKFHTELGLDLNLWPSYCEATVLTAAPLCPTHHTKKNLSSSSTPHWSHLADWLFSVHFVQRKDIFLRKVPFICCCWMY